MGVLNWKFPGGFNLLKHLGSERRKTGPLICSFHCSLGSWRNEVNDTNVEPCSGPFVCPAHAPDVSLCLFSGYVDAFFQPGRSTLVTTLSLASGPKTLGCLLFQGSALPFSRCVRCVCPAQGPPVQTAPHTGGDTLFQVQPTRRYSQKTSSPLSLCV